VNRVCGRFLVSKWREKERGGHITWMGRTTGWTVLGWNPKGRWFTNHDRARAGVDKEGCFHTFPSLFVAPYRPREQNGTSQTPVSLPVLAPAPGLPAYFSLRDGNGLRSKSASVGVD